MQILFLTLSGSFVNPDIGIKRGIYIDLVKELMKRGHTVYIVTPLEKRTGGKTLLYNTAGIHLLHVSTGNVRYTSPISKGISTVLLEYQFIKEIKKKLRGIQFDLVLLSTPPITFEKVVKFIKKRDNATSYLLLKDIFPQNAVDVGFFSKRNPVYWYFRRKEKKLYKLADHIGCMSPANVTYIKKHNPGLNNKTIEVCPNSIYPISGAISEKEKLYIKTKYNIPVKSLVFFYGGNLGRPQGIDFLLSIIGANQNNVNIYFLIVGFGTEYSKVKSWFNTHKPSNAAIYPEVPKNEFDKLTQMSDVGMIFLNKNFTIPNFPSRLLAYMESSKPVIAATDRNTDLGQIMVKNEFGLWSESGDIATFLKNAETLINSKALRVSMGANGRRFLEQNYHVSDACATILKRF